MACHCQPAACTQQHQPEQGLSDGQGVQAKAAAVDTEVEQAEDELSCGAKALV